MCTHAHAHIYQITPFPPPPPTDLERPTGQEDEAAPVLMQYEDGYHYQNVMAPLVREGDGEGDCI